MPASELFRTLVIRGRAAKYAVSVLLGCVVAVLTAVPVFGQTVKVTLVGAGDIANCSHDNDENTASLLRGVLTLPDGTLRSPNLARVITIGDNVYPSGTADRFANCYDNLNHDDRSDWWGQYKDRTMPTLGNHDYTTSGAGAYFDYFGGTGAFAGTGASPQPAPGTRGKGYYSYDLGSWHIVALNSNCDKVGGCTSSSPQGRWLKKDLAKHRSQRCTLAYFHHPLYASGTRSDTPEVKPLWQILYDRKADVILSGHAHRYERFRPINPNGDRDRRNGIRQFIVGTGGEPGGVQFGGDDPNSQVKLLDTPGVIKLTLAAASYSWRFIPVRTAGQTFTESGTDQCH
jgi:calcineurin-like phosphoesterase family protein